MIRPAQWWCPGRSRPKLGLGHVGLAATRYSALRQSDSNGCRVPALDVAVGFAGADTGRHQVMMRRRPGLALNDVSPPPLCRAALQCRRAHSDPAPLFRFSDDTIYALSSAEGRAGIAVIRVSGPACLDVYKGLCPGKALPKPRYAHVRALVDSASCPLAPETLDPGALVLYFPGPNSVTGEDVLELHTHGGPATVRAVLSAIPRSVSSPRPAPRYASPGEFTRRAFANSRLDLAQIESLGDALAADTEQQRRAAVRGSSGVLGRAYDGWRADLLAARAELEALIDFAEDQAFDASQADLLTGVAAQVGRILADIRRHEDGGVRAELLRRGIAVALVGQPNVGKSSLLNRIVGREASIVSGEAGTTRDVVETQLDVGGYLCTFADTAGIRSVPHAGKDAEEDADRVVGAVEKEGIRRAKAKAVESDVVVVLTSIERGPSGDLLVECDEETLRLAAAAQASVIAVNKRDTAPDAAALQALLDRLRESVLGRVAGLSGAPLVAISCKEAQDPALAPNDADDPGGICGLMATLAGRFGSLTSLPVDMQDLLGVTERQRRLLEECRHYLDEFMGEARPRPVGGDADIVLAAEYLRFAAMCLARITGRVEGGDVEEVLGVVFERFCVGK